MGIDGKTGDGRSGTNQIKGSADYADFAVKPVLKSV
jgi:hypothetical protein